MVGKEGETRGEKISKGRPKEIQKRKAKKRGEKTRKREVEKRENKRDDVSPAYFSCFLFLFYPLAATNACFWHFPKKFFACPCQSFMALFLFGLSVGSEGVEKHVHYREK